MGIIKKIGGLFGKGYSQLKRDSGKFQSNVVPFTPAAGAVGAIAKGAGLAKDSGAIAKGAGLAKDAFKYISTITTQKAFNPMAGAKTVKEGLKQLGGAVGAGAATFGLGSIAYQGANAIVSGNTPNAGDFTKNVVKSSAIGASTGISKFPGFAGILEGTGTNVSKVAKDFYNKLAGKGQSMIPDNWQSPTNKFKDITNDLPTYPMPDINLTYNLPNGFTPRDILPSTPQTFVFESPSPSAGFNPSFSLGGGGMGDSLPIWLLAAGLGGGFLLGRKKRRKKKYKKRKRR